MSHVDGYTHAKAISRAPVDIQGKVSPHIEKLHELGVKAVGPNASPPPPVNTRAEKLAVRANLKTTFAKSREKAKNIANQLLGGGLHAKLQGRLSRLDPQQTATLKGQLHFGGWEASRSSTKPEDRVVIRSAMLSAFAHGASFNETARLRSFLMTADGNTRNEVFAALNKPDANTGRILDYFQRGPFRAPDDGAEQLGGAADKAEGGRGMASKQMNRLTDAFLAKQGVIAPTPPPKDADPKTVEAHELAVSEYNNKKVGAMAVSAYTSGFYVPVNKQLRAQDGGTGQMREDTDLMTRAATDFLSKLPDFQGIVARGGGAGWQDIASEIYKPGLIVTEQAFTSGSPNKGFSGSIQFIIESRHGKEISDLSLKTGDGREVVFPPGTKFEVLTVEKSDEKVPALDANMNRIPDENVMFIVLREVE